MRWRGDYADELLVLLAGRRTTREEQGGGKLGARGRGAEGEAGKQRPGGTPANLAVGTVAVTRGEVGQAGRLAVALVIPATAAARAGRGWCCGADRGDKAAEGRGQEVKKTAW